MCTAMLNYAGQVGRFTSASKAAAGKHTISVIIRLVEEVEICMTFFYLYMLCLFILLLCPRRALRFADISSRDGCRNRESG